MPDPWRLVVDALAGRPARLPARWPKKQTRRVAREGQVPTPQEITARQLLRAVLG